MSTSAIAISIEPCPAAREGDAAAFLHRVFYEELGFTPDPGLDKDFAGLVGHYRRGRGELWIATDSGRVVGTTALFDRGVAAPGGGVGEGTGVTSGGDAELKRMFIDRAVRGIGLGRRLLDVAIAHARATGFGRVVLDTKLDMRAALGLYRSAGFEEIPDYNGNQRAEVFMALRLD